MNFKMVCDTDLATTREPEFGGKQCQTRWFKLKKGGEPRKG